MAINKNHPFEDLNGVKCAVVETGINAERVGFLKSLLEFNKYMVVVAVAVEKKAPAPKPVAAAADADAAPAETIAEAPLTPVADEKFTLGVTDVTFNSTNAIYGRLLKAPNGSVVTMAYWQQRDAVSNDAIPYFDRK